MKDFFSKIKKNLPICLGSIILYQVLLTILFYSKTNMRILSTMIVSLALIIIYKEYMGTLKEYVKKKTSATKKEE